MQYRKATKIDIDNIIMTGVQAFCAGPYFRALLVERRHGMIGGKSAKTRLIENQREFCEKNIDLGNVLVATDQQKIVGFCCLVLREKELGEICDLAVEPSYQCRGIATQLLRLAFEEMKKRGANIVQVSTLETAPDALKTYEKAGFKELVRGVTYSKAL